MPKLRKKTSPGGLALTVTLTAPCPPTGQPSTELEVNLRSEGTVFLLDQ